MHRSTAGIVGVTGIAIHHRQSDFDILQRHAKETDDPHPHQCSGPPGTDGEGHSGDVAQSDGGREGSGQCLEVIDRPGIIRVIVDPFDDIDPVGHDPVLGDLCPQGEKNARTQQANKSQGAPDESADGIDTAPELFHLIPPLELSVRSVPAIGREAHGRPPAGGEVPEP